MKIYKVLTSVLFAVLLTNCKSSPPRTETPAPEAAAAASHPTESNLTQTEAEERALGVSDVKYQLNIELDNSSEKFKAAAQVEFERKESTHDLFLDLKSDATIDSFSLNGKIYPVIFAHHRVMLPQALLLKGTNKVTLQYQQNYAKNGRGLHRFQDPEDKRIYLHSQFEAFDAHQMFPCFDQPDIKATMIMTVTAPKDWEVITTTRERTKRAIGDKLEWTFPETPRISTYLFSLHAGPFAKWEAKAGPVPLRLFARQSMKQFVVLKDWFVPTQAGLKFYGEFFAYPYPFKKYDQIIVPEFNAGAMENVAAITFSERFLHRSASTLKERESLSSVILHEMAHMWFGDLVTMQWWNGLWLNESFATYMAGLSQSKVTEFKDSWISFYRNKSGAYIEDQLVTTHPIEARIVDTDSAFSNFDSITYGKGASALKQLSYYLGEENFRDGVRYYFKQHAYHNTRLEDFIGALEHSSHKELGAWSKSWLELAGVDTVSAEYTCADGKVSQFALKLEGPNGDASPRAHRTLVTLFQEKSGKIVPLKQESVIYQGARTEIPQFKGAACPVMVYPNEQDQDYVKVRLDAATLAAAKVDLHKISANFTRMMFWPNLFSMVRDVDLIPQDYLKIVMLNLPGETDLTIGETIARTLPAILQYLPNTTDAEKKARAVWVADTEALLWKKLESSPSSDWKKLALRSFTENVETAEGRERLLGLLDGKIKFNGLVLDADRRWEMIVRLAALGDTKVEPILAQQRESDKSDRGVGNALAAEATKPTLASKVTWISKVVDHDEMSFDQKREVLSHLLPHQQDDLRASLSEQFYTALPKLAKTRELGFLTLYASALIPATCTPASAAKLGTFLTESAGMLPTPVIKNLRNGQQEDSRCVAIRARAASAN